VPLHPGEVDTGKFSQHRPGDSPSDRGARCRPAAPLLDPHRDLVRIIVVR